MFSGRKDQEKDLGALELNISPLIDVIFILLIFFMVSTIFAKDTGVEVNKPISAFGEQVQNDYMRLALTAEGQIFQAGERKSDQEIERLARDFRRLKPEGTIVIIPDQDTRAGRLVSVMDIFKRAGNKKVILATEQN